MRYCANVKRLHSRYLLLLGLCAAACNDPLATGGQRAYLDVATGGDHSCAIASDGGAYCWGRGLDGELGIGVKENRSRPTRVTGSLTFTQITAGEAHTCGLATTGVAYCWGWNAFFQRGNPDDPHDADPVQTTTPVRFRSITAGTYHTCGLSLDSLAYCWGNNTYGQVGAGNTGGVFVPTAVSGAIKFNQLSAGGWHTCGVSRANTVFCWGRNDQGQLGIGTSGTNSAVPVQANTTVRFQQIDAGTTHTCAASTGGRFYCWGSSEHGELGNGSVTKPGLPAATTPGQVSDLFPSGPAIVAGNDYTCAISTNSRGRCWGRNDFGQVAEGSFNDQFYPQPLILPGSPPLDITKFAAGGNLHVCALIDQAVFCWGSGSSGQTGNGIATIVNLPQRVRD